MTRIVPMTLIAMLLLPGPMQAESLRAVAALRSRSRKTSNREPAWAWGGVRKAGYWALAMSFSSVSVVGNALRLRGD